MTIVTSQTTLGECVTFLSGGTPSKSNPAYWGGDVPWVSCKDMKVDRLHDTEDHITKLGAQNGTRLVDRGTILIVVRGMILAKVFPVGIAQRQVAFNQDLKALICRNGVVSEYLYYWLKAHEHEIVGLADEAAHGTKRLQTDRLVALDVELPQEDYQRRIAAILSAYDDLIENNTRRIQILEEIARRIYEEWFVRFRFPGHENVSMVKSELGLIPEGWTLKRLGEVLELVYGKALKADEREEGNVPVYGSSGIVGFHNVPLVREAGIIVGRKGNVGSVHLSDAPFYPIDTVYYTRTELPLSYVFFNLKRQNFINNDAAVPGLNRNQAHSLPFVLPTDNLIKRFDELAQKLFGLSGKLQAQNDNLRRTRDLLLPKLISGEIDVSNFPEPVTD